MVRSILERALVIFFLSTSVCRGTEDDDDGPLLLTPLIEKGEYDKARNLSKVDPTLFVGLESYSAFITVNKTSSSHLFFWFFPVESKPIESTPWIIWLQGGPGVSSLFGLFVEMGPLQFVNGTVQKRPITWASDYSVLFIDSPVGTGFSFTEKKQYATNEDEIGACLLNFIQQFLLVFPELRNAPLFIAGESYGGKFIIAFGHYIHSNRNKTQPINFKGIAIGDGFIDPPPMLQYSKFGLEVGVLDPQQSAQVEAIEDVAKKAYNDGDMKTYRREWSHAYITFIKLSNLHNPYNYVNDEKPVSDYVLLLNERKVQKALHVGRAVFMEISWAVYSALSNDFPLSVKPWLEELLNNKYAVMCYGGQLDVIVAYALLVNVFNDLQWFGIEGYIKAPRWLFMGKDNQAEMYIKEYDNFVDVMIRGAGHMTSYDQPRKSKEIINYFIDKFHNYTVGKL